MSARDADFSSMSNAELLDLWVRTEKEWPAIEHGGRRNRLAKRCIKILDLLKMRTDGTTRFLQPLLSHADPGSRLSAAIGYKRVDHAAYVAVVGELARRKDEIGRKARSSLEWDAQSAQFSQTEPTPEQLARSRESANRRVSRPPPEGISRPQLETRLRRKFPSELAATLLGVARPAIGLWPQRPPADAPATASRFGGMPCVPSGWSWPTCESEPLFFLAQINCRDVADLAAAVALPRDGVLAFFGDHDWVNGFPNFSPLAAVYYWPDPSVLRVAEPPIEDFELMPRCALGFFETTDLPHPLSMAIIQLQLDGDAEDRYWDLYRALRAETHGDEGIDVSKLFGWPDLVQRDLEMIEAGDEAWQLLLQLGSYETGTESHGWGPGGNLYFMIETDALAARRFDLCAAEMQCT